MEKPETVQCDLDHTVVSFINQEGGAGDGEGSVQQDWQQPTLAKCFWAFIHLLLHLTDIYRVSPACPAGAGQRQKQFLFSWSVSSRIRFHKEASAYFEGNLSGHMAPLSSWHMTWNVPCSNDGLWTIMDGVWIFQGHPTDGKLFNEDSPAFLKYLLPDFTKFNGKYFAHRKNVHENKDGS